MFHAKMTLIYTNDTLLRLFYNFTNGTLSLTLTFSTYDASATGRSVAVCHKF